MLNRIISLVYLLLFFNINAAYSETNFILPVEKPSIFKKTEKQIQDSISQDLPVPKPKLEKKKEDKSKEINKEKKPTENKTVEKKPQKEVKISLFILPQKKTYYL